MDRRIKRAPETVPELSEPSSENSKLKWKQGVLDRGEEIDWMIKGAYCMDDDEKVHPLLRWWGEAFGEVEEDRGPHGVSLSTAFRFIGCVCDVEGRQVFSLLLLGGWLFCSGFLGRGFVLAAHDSIRALGNAVGGRTADALFEGLWLLTSYIILLSR
jgi:hypothetical protein